MAFAQLTYRESLRDIEACLRCLGGKLYHMGFRGKSGPLYPGRCEMRYMIGASTPTLPKC